MNDPIRSMRRAADQIRPPADWLRSIEERRRRKRRNERIGATAVGLGVMAALLGSVVTLTSTGRPDHAPASAHPSVVKMPLGSFQNVVYRNGFNDADSGWPQRRKTGFEAVNDSNGYRISVLRPFENRWWGRPIVGQSSIIDVRVSVRTEVGGGAGWAGVMCLRAGTPLSGYGFVINEQSTRWRILSITRTSFGSDITVLDQGSAAFVGARINTGILGRCEVTDAGTELSIRLDAEIATTVIDSLSSVQFIGVGMFVESGASQAVARFDDLVVGVPGP